MSAAADKFARLAALKPSRPTAARSAAIRMPSEEELLGRLLGGSIARPGKMALPRHRNYRPGWGHGHVRIFDWTGVVGCRWITSRTIFHARLCGRAFTAAGIISARRRAARARYLQRKIVRLAAA